MKTLLSTIFSLLMVMLFALSGEIFAQTSDTLDVAATPAGNINKVVAGDTLAGGVRAHPNRVYRLKRGSVYQVTEPMKINGALKIVATEGTDRPPVLAPAILADNSSIDNFFNLVGKNSKVEINDVYFLSFRADGNQLGWSEAIRINESNVALKLRRVIFDGFTSAAIRQYRNWITLDVQDCKFRNMQHTTSYFGGQSFMSDGLNSADSIKFINNTFFAVNAYIFSIRGFDKYATFNHNSIVYSVVNPFLTRQAYNLYMNNNLFYAAHALGGTPEMLRGSNFLNYPDTTASSIIFIRAKRDTVDGTVLAGEEAFIDSANGVYAPMVDPANRMVDITKNAYFFPQKLVDFYKTWNDTVTVTDIFYGQPVKRTLTMAKWINDYTQKNIDSVLPKVSPKVVVKDNINADPTFTDTRVVAHIDTVINYIKQIAIGKIENPWFFHSPTQYKPYPPVWPLPENLAYSNASLVKGGKDGFAIGDLNWFPDQRAKFNPDATGVLTVKAGPSDYSLSQNYPNPFNPETKIQFSMKSSERVRLVVYNILGQAVRTLVNQDMKAGTYSVSFNGRDDLGKQLASGIYMYSLESSSFKVTKKMMLVK